MGRAQQQAEAKVEIWEPYTEELLAQLEFRIASIESHQARIFEHLREVDRFIHKQQ
jgi:hypothetical protein